MLALIGQHGTGGGSGWSDIMPFQAAPLSLGRKQLLPAGMFAARNGAIGPVRVGDTFGMPMREQIDLIVRQGSKRGWNQHLDGFDKVVKKCCGWRRAANEYIAKGILDLASQIPWGGHGAAT